MNEIFEGGWIEEDGWQVVQCYLSYDLASDSEDEKQLSRACREAAVNKNKLEPKKQKDKRKQFRNVLDRLRSF